MNVWISLRSYSVERATAKITHDRDRDRERHPLVPRREANEAAKTYLQCIGRKRGSGDSNAIHPTAARAVDPVSFSGRWPVTSSWRALKNYFTDQLYTVV